MATTRPERPTASRTLLAIGIALSLTSVSPAIAQDQSDAGAVKTLEQVDVTGSRIPREGFITPSPVTVLNAEDIKLSGFITIGDLLNQLPQLATTFSLSNSSRFIGTVGLNLLDLRGLGTDRTLVLVDGRRHVGSSPGTASVDVNTIPIEWIERVEVITGGASAVYGADAVAGVVNFIMKKNISGITLRGQYGLSEEGQFDRYFASITGGSSFADGRGNAAFSAEFSEQGRLLASDRDQTRPSFRTLRLAQPDENGFQRQLLENAGLFTFARGGVFALGPGGPLGNRFVFDPDGSVRPQRFDGIVDLSGQGCQDCDLLNLSDVTDLQPGFRRGSFNTRIDYAVAENHHLVFEGKYTQTDALFLSQPSFDSGIRIFRENPFVTPELAAIMDANNAQFISLNRFHVDAGQRGEDVKRQTARAVLALEGIVFGDWNYDLSAVWGQTTESRANLANRVDAKFFAGLDAVRDPVSGEIVCRSTLDPTATLRTAPNGARAALRNQQVPGFAANGCVPFNILGDGQISQEARDYFNTVANSAGEVRQTVFSASLSQSSLFSLPAGDVGFAGGFEYRQEESEQRNDPLAAQGLTFLNAIPNSKGDFDVKELFAEFTVPLLADIALVDSLVFDAAGRYSDYDTIGETFTWKLGLDWQVVEDVRIRSTLSLATRAPNIGELFDPQGQNFFGIADPCSTANLNLAPDEAVRRANCLALGLPADFFSQINSSRPGVSGGNPDLREEDADTFTLGFVINPRWLPNLNLSLDYWNIKVTDVIGSTSGQETANRCVDSRAGINNEFCDRITRDATGEITFVVASLQNLQKLKTSGYDFEAAYLFENVFGGSLTSRVTGTYLIKSRFFPFQDDPAQFFESTTLLGSPKWRTNLSTVFKKGGLTASWDARYLSNQIRTATLESFNANPLQTAAFRTGSYVYHDLQVRYKFGNGLTTYAGVDNVFDKDLPFGNFANGAGSALFDNIGRAYYAGIEYSF